MNCQIFTWLDLLWCFFSCKLLIGNIMISHAVWVNKHLSNYKQFSKTTNCTMPYGSIIQFCCVCSIHEKIKSNQYLIKITLQKDINTHWYPTNLSVGNSQLFTACSWWREKCIIFIRTLLLSQGSDYHLISPWNITSKSHIEVMRIKELITN